ncbi:MAG: hypothetical protein ABFS19_06115, partial [Thermodesulfobacteriota bacterium]
KPMLEITAAVDGGIRKFRQPAQPKSTVTTKTASKMQETAAASMMTYNRTMTIDKTPAKTVTDCSVFDRVGDPLPDIHEEVSELKEIVLKLTENISEKQNTTWQRLSSGRKTRDSSSPDTSPAVSLDQYITPLLERGINLDTARTIAEFSEKELSDHDRDDNVLLSSFYTDSIEDIIEVAPDEPAAPSEQRRIAFIGPTGVGKTTTLAKVAASHMAKGIKSIGLITIDTYRIAAIEQLKVYGKIMRLPVEVVISPDQLQDALDKFHDKELILIDTAGRSPRDHLSINELGSYLSGGIPIEKHLVLSATTREEEICQIIDRFSPIGIDHTIVTKIDECDTLGIILDVQTQTPAPFSYITNGQRVPEDIMVAESRMIAELIMTPEGSPTP